MVWVGMFNNVPQRCNIQRQEDVLRVIGFLKDRDEEKGERRS